ncbi:uncharacterized protein LOC144420858 isoform X2 [Styela clava]
MTNEMTNYEISGSGDTDGLNAIEVKNSTEACLEKVCGNDANCVPLNSSVFICRCGTGFDSVASNSTFTCKDINECPDGVNTHLCALTGTCANKPGGYDCTCNIGYENGTYGPCSNINECSRNTDNCDTNADCADTVGSFTCACKTFYTGNGTTCVDIDECAMGTHACGDTGTCVNKVGEYNCWCNSGYEGGIGGPCTDIKECNSPTTNACSAQADCTDTIGSYLCVCKTGYTGDGRTCNDINECTSNTHICHDKADCTNNNGSFTCTCKSGYIGTGTTCTDINECAIDTDNCHNNAKCTNNDGSFTCACETGFTGDGFNCADNDECTLKTDNCHSNATCGNTFGSFTCTCKTGYTGNGIECTDQNECDTSPCDTNAACSNNDGSFTCECNSGFTGNGFTCTDDDECTLKTDNCNTSATCTNILGSFRCACKTGFTGDGVTCEGSTLKIDAYGFAYKDATGNGTIKYFSSEAEALKAIYNMTNEMTNYEISGSGDTDGPNATEVKNSTEACLEKVCGNDADCVPLNSSVFICRCATGFDSVLSNSTFACKENECLRRTHNCSINSVCNNTDDGYECSCNDGFIGDGHNCSDVDECMSADKKCHSNALCFNTPGNYECKCKSGYTGNGINCNLINACEKLGNCDFCWKNAGGVECICNEGYSGSVEYGGNDQYFTQHHYGYNNITCFRFLYNCSFENDRCQCSQTLREINTYCFKVDQCTSGQHDCDENATCIDSANGTYTCQCKEGFTGNGFNCTDINECSSEFLPCSNCSNTVGGYSCGCEKGFDGENCTDIDECQTGRHNCHPRAKCTNTYGSYNCTCDADYYEEGDDGTWCSGCPGNSWTKWIDADIGYEYRDNNKFYSYAMGRGDFELLSLIKNQLHSTNICANPTNAMAQVTNGKHYLEGEDKVHMSINGIYCLNYEQNDGNCDNYNVKFCCPPENKCSSGKHNCSDNALCNNTAEGYTCSCNDGFTGDGYNCTDVDECMPDNKCHSNAQCINTIGSYECKCKPGYTGNGINCNLINECEELGKCDYCWKNAGGVECICNEGYSGSVEYGGNDQYFTQHHYGYNNITCFRFLYNCSFENDRCQCSQTLREINTYCFKVDQCTSGQHDCDENATCIDSANGTYTCQCEEGFTGNGFNCTDINECLSEFLPCSNCSNTVGGYSCGCEKGFDGENCTDIDECQTGRHNCHPRAKCTNTYGSYNCTCDADYYEEGDDGTWCSGCPGNSWTKWIDADIGYEYRDNNKFYSYAMGRGDFELLSLIKNQLHSTNICANPTNAMAQVTNGKHYLEGEDKVHMSINGIYCLNYEQNDGNCNNYNVKFCCPPENKCSSGKHNCSDNALCNNTAEGYTCSCNDGFTGDGYNCTDVDECMPDNKCQSNAQCINTIGSYECKCKPGYTGNGINCNLINECEELGNCDYCWKNAGGVECICNEGYSGSVEYGGNDQYFTQHHYGYNNITCFRFLYNCSFENDRCQCSQTLREINTYCFKVDQCTSGQHDCDENATCIDSANGTYTCQCKEGFTGNGFNCTDINECSSEFLPCSNCSNTVGGYSCGCEKGFDGENCTDIDECQTGRHNCHPRAKCTNTYGSYNCTCDADYYEEGDDGTWCSGCPGNSWTKWIDADIGYEYRDNNKFYSYAMGRGDFELLSLIKNQLHSTNICANPTNAMAQVTNGKHYLEGEDKVHMSINGIYCLNYEQNDGNCNNYNVKFCCPPENKCSNGKHNCSGNALCNNTDDGYTCSCIDGFTGDGYNCTDVDECMTGNKCHSNAQCINTIGSYECKCEPGYTGNGTNCNNINECGGLGNCDYCSSYGSTFECYCSEGFSGWAQYGGNDQYISQIFHNYDNVTCLRILYNCSFVNNRCQCYQTLREINTYCFKVDQCTSGQHDCDENATCIDSANGTYTCQCNEGFTGNGFNCTDINECSNEFLPCSNCSNTVGGYSCGCEKGFDGENCTDIDECQTGRHNCHPRAKCTNTYGSYNCTCDADYYEEDDDGTWCTGCPGDSWTKWIDADIGYQNWNRDNFYSVAFGRGDFELFSLIKDQLHSTNICASPTNAMAQVANGKHYLEGGDKVHMSIDGIYCLHSEQEDGRCNNYNVKFCCPDNTSAMNSTKSNNITAMTSTEPTESISWLGSITGGQSEIITTFVCIGSPIDVQWTKSPAGSTFLYKLQNRDRTTNKIKQTSVKMLLPGEQLFKVTRMLSPSPDFCVTSTKISSDRNDITVEQVARIEQNRMNSVSKVIHKLQSKTVRLTFVDFE